MPAECNGCGKCCDPVSFRRETWDDVLNWGLMKADAVSPELRHHVENGKFARRWWVGNVIWADATVVAIQCPHYDVETRRCGAYTSRPPICRGFPWYGEDPVEKMRSGMSLPVECSYWEDVPVEIRRPECA